MVDLQGRGHLTRSDIMAHIQSKLPEVDSEIVEIVLSKMKWDGDDQVTKEEFCGKYHN